MAGGNLILSWNGFMAHTSTTFKQLWNDSEFTDITLATMDDHQIRAHKVVLATSSQLFKHIMSKNPHPNPLIYLKDINHRDLEEVLKFLYLGHSEVEEGCVESFLAAGRALGVTGIMEGISLVVEERGDSYEIKEEETEMDITELCKETVQNNIEEVQESEVVVNVPVRKKKKIKISQEKYVEMDRSELNNPQSRTYGCGYCDFRTTTKNDLIQHKQIVHEEVSFDCTKCNFKSNSHINLKSHEQAMHKKSEPISVSKCNDMLKGEICGQIFNSIKEKKLHFRVVHAILKCVECDKGFKTKRTLEKHINRHKLVKVPSVCPDCGKTCFSRGHLKSHIKFNHEVSLKNPKL